MKDILPKVRKLIRRCNDCFDGDAEQALTRDGIRWLTSLSREIRLLREFYEAHADLHRIRTTLVKPLIPERDRQELESEEPKALSRLQHASAKVQTWRTRHGLTP